MVSSDLTKIKGIAVHKVGNKLLNEGVKSSRHLLQTDEQINELLMAYFLSPFKDFEYYNFFHDSDIQLNELYSFASQIFDNPDRLHEQSTNIARHLYNNSDHPKIKSGELYVVYFKDCVAVDEIIDAVGIFKSESKETFLKVYPKDDGFEVSSDTGINISKLDKGCLIFNTGKENGYVVSVVDKTGKGADATFWFEKFLKVKLRTDKYYYTKNLIGLCKSFVETGITEEYDVSGADQADLLNKSQKYLKEKDSFDFDEFAQEVMEQPGIIDSFTNFKEKYEEEMNLDLSNEFDISKEAVKKQARYFKSILKLDKNFHIYVHGNRQYIHRGYDAEKGLSYYQLFFNEEN